MSGGLAAVVSREEVVASRAVVSGGIAAATQVGARASWRW